MLEARKRSGDLAVDVQGPLLALEAEEGATGPGGSGVRHTAQEANAAEGVGPASFAAINARNRREALKWTESEPLGDLIMARLIIEPLRAYLKAHFVVGSAKWEKLQQGR